jgi:hypothetical protein
MSRSARRVTEGTAASPLSAAPILEVLAALRRGTGGGGPGPSGLGVTCVVDLPAVASTMLADGVARPVWF